MDKPLKEIDNLQEAFNTLVNEMRNIQGKLTTLNFDYINNYSGTLISSQNDTMISVVNSLRTRCNSIHFHFTQLIDLELRTDKRINDEAADYDNAILHTQTSDKLYFLFESIVFNVISLFDYFGSLVEYICIGKGEAKQNWNGIMKGMRDKKNLLYNLTFKDQFIAWNKNFIDILFGYRSDLIHRNIDFGGNALYVNPSDGKYHSVYKAPHKFCSKFSELKKEAKEYQFTNRYVAFWIVSKSNEAALDIIQSISEFMKTNRKTTANRELIFMKK